LYHRITQTQEICIPGYSPLEQGFHFLWNDVCYAIWRFGDFKIIKY